MDKTIIIGPDGSYAEWNRLLSPGEIEQIREAERITRRDTNERIRQNIHTATETLRRILNNEAPYLPPREHDETQ